MVEWLADGKMWSHYSASASVIGGFSTGLGILIGGISLLLICVQTFHSARVARQIAALEAHKDYIRLCIDYPEISSHELMKAHLKVEDFQSILIDMTTESEKALWFFSYVLFAMEHLILTNTYWSGVAPAWQSTVEDQLGYHAELLGVVWPDWKAHYSIEMDRVVQKVLDREYPSGVQN